MKRPTRNSANMPPVPTAVTGITPERVVREGDKAEEVLKLIDEEEDVFILVLGAGMGTEGPGPLVATLAVPRATIRFR